ncbi:hypothetical protein ABZ923_14110 [Streptomyces sp. NPDC046881]|uniref:hypothetical protein n=1 Tax=Streptomyces sp. NPDC046881 TaxID=3155374 RepID=UPI0033D69E85
MTKALRGRPVRLGSYTYLPAPTETHSAKGVLMRGGLPVTLEATEEILQEFMDRMNSLESDISQRWVGADTWFRLSPAE